MAANVRQVVVDIGFSRPLYDSTRAPTATVAAERTAGALRAFHSGWTRTWTDRPTARAPSEQTTVARGQGRGRRPLSGRAAALIVSPPGRAAARPGRRTPAR